MTPATTFSDHDVRRIWRQPERYEKCVGDLAKVERIRPLLASDPRTLA